MGLEPTTSGLEIRRSIHWATETLRRQVLPPKKLGFSPKPRMAVCSLKSVNNNNNNMSNNLKKKKKERRQRVPQDTLFR